MILHKNKCKRIHTHIHTHTWHILQACVVFFDEVDAIGGARFDDGAGGDNEVQRTMLEIVNQLDGFDARGNVKVCVCACVRVCVCV
jgi:ATP-dependent 26S proteasome regulatory subunit